MTIEATPNKTWQALHACQVFPVTLLRTEESTLLQSDQFLIHTGQCLALLDRFRRRVNRQEELDQFAPIFWTRQAIDSAGARRTVRGKSVA